ncbi:Pollen Ole e 1 allergen/extensin [Melia azedarach]|uniref:Pollen Ole e 1 allergen/extensin n=1 Tax=Melia azedarach TaxID=155640 RepID=A0ACC1Z0S3_MELAZ|nr:Pollen Ole e 1 allergen/extensin [Melia azedarach]
MIILYKLPKLFVEKLMWKFASYLPKSGTMSPIISFFLISSLFITAHSLKVQHPKPNAQITVLGFVYCDICSNNSFSRHSYFIPGAEVQIDCKFKTLYPRTREQISFSVNRTTNRKGIYKLDIPSVDGIACADAAIASSCQASLLSSSSSSCNVPGYRSTTNQIAIKSKQANICFYSLNPLTFRPSRRDITLCGK